MRRWSKSAAGTLAGGAGLRRTSRWIAGALVALLPLGCGGGGGGGGGGASPLDYVLAPDQAHYGASYGLWSARWWQWVYELPRPHHPLFDTTGEDAHQGQVNPVWFLGGVYSVSGSAERRVTIPKGVALFFPVINVESDDRVCFPGDWVVSVTELRGFAYTYVSAVRDLYCTLDGATIINSPDLAGAVRYRADSPEFSYVVPANNILDPPCATVVNGGPIGPAVSDGIWVMLAPLPEGEHTLTFGGTFPVPTPFHLDIIYHITVAP